MRQIRTRTTANASSSGGAPDEAELLADGGEREVGPDHRDVAAVRQRPCSQPLPKMPPVPTARTALVTWYTSFSRSGLFSSKNTRTRASWYGLTRRPTNAAPSVASDSRLIVSDVAGLGAGDEQHAHRHGDQHRGRPRSGWTMISTAGRPTIISPPRKRG